jgi:prevent-host-death family protein
MADTVVNIHRAKTTLSQLVARAERGERITIARSGKPVAQLGPPPRKPRRRPSEDDALLRVDEYAWDGPVSPMTNADIDRAVYGA